MSPQVDSATLTDPQPLLTRAGTKPVDQTYPFKRSQNDFKCLKTMPQSLIWMLQSVLVALFGQVLLAEATGSITAFNP